MPAKTNKWTHKPTSLPIYKGVSASQLDVGCDRRFAAKHIFRLHEPKNPYAKFGIIGHDIIKKWYVEGVKPEGNTIHERAVLGAWQLLPARDQIDLMVEKKAAFNAGTFVMEGPVDLAFRDPDDPGLIHVYDWKFTGDANKNKKSPRKLLEDAQQNIYALAMMQKFDVTRCRMHWIYISRKGNDDKTHDARPVVVDVDWESSIRMWHQRHEAKAQHLIALHESEYIDLSDFDADLTGRACWAYGSLCPHKTVCMLATEKKEMGDDASAVSSLWDDVMDDDEESSPPPKKEEPATKEEKPKRRRGRPPKEEKAEEKEPTKAEDDPINPPESPKKRGGRRKRRTKAEIAADKKAKQGFDLVVLCDIVKGPDAIMLEDAMRDVIDSLESEHGVAHWRMIKYGGKSEMSAACRAAVQRGDFNGMTILVSSWGSLAEVCVEELAPAADTYLRGR